MSEEAHKTRLLEVKAIRLEVEVQALEFEECGQESLKQRLRDFEEETDPIPLDNGTVLPTNGSPNAYTSTSKQPTEPQQLNVKIGNQEVTKNDWESISRFNCQYYCFEVVFGFVAKVEA